MTVIRDKHGRTIASHLNTAIRSIETTLILKPELEDQLRPLLTQLIEIKESVTIRHSKSPEQREVEKQINEQRQRERRERIKIQAEEAGVRAAARLEAARTKNMNPLEIAVNNASTENYP